jgi:iron complex outermembrane receptor protein
MAWTGIVSTFTLSRKWAAGFPPLAILGEGVMHSFTRIVRGAALIPSAAALALAMFSSPTLAQKPEADEVESPSEELEEVMVTAQRRSENLMTTPIAAASLSENDLQRKGVATVLDLQYATPSLSVQEVGHTSSFNIRGIGQQSTDLNAVPGVPLYVDGMLNPTILTSNAYFDTASVEVLRGPQGTFAGASSTGGAIFVNSKNPDFTGGLHGTFGARIGNYHDLGFNGAVNLPLTDTLAGRIAVDVERRDSFFVNAGAQPGPTKTAYNTPGALDEKQIRASLLWAPIDDVSFLWKTLYSTTSTGGYPYIPLPSPILAPYVSQVYPDPSRVLHLDTVEMSVETAVRSTLEAKWKIADSVTLRSLTGYGSYRSTQVHDIDATVLDLPQLGSPHIEEDADTPETTISQELNLLSPETGPLQWILGAFYYHDNIGQVSHAVQTGSGDNFNNVDIHKRSTAGFGQISYQLTSKLQLQVGGRYTKDTARTSGYNVTVGSAPSPRIGAYDGHNVTGKVALNYQLNDDNFLYVFAAKGANAGGTANGVPFKPAIVKDYEAGWKASFLDGHARSQLGVFHNDLDNFQADALTPVNGTITPTNIPKARIDGIELQLQAKVGGFGFDFSGNYIHSKMEAFTIINLHDPAWAGGFVPLPQCPPGSPSIPNVCWDFGSSLLSIANAPLPYLPKVTYSVGLEYAFALPNSNTLTPRVNFSHQGDQWAGPTEVYPVDFLAAHDLIGAQLTFEHGAYQVVAYGSNLANKTYVSGQSPPAYFLGAPRQYGVRLAIKF